jgi:lipopolysaccharide/colanic/teichoic acid biosynthesis glycosyltransferase
MELTKASDFLCWGREDLQRLVNGICVEIILAITRDLQGEMIRALLSCQRFGVQVTLMPALYEQIGGRVPIQHIGDHWYAALPLDHPGVGGTYPIIKRALDILGASIGLAVYAPLFPIIALAIYVDSPGPIFYRQERVGKGGRIFRLVKLRTMVRDAEKDGAVFAAEGDPRVTRVGRVLRKTRLDEFPQLINVMLGEMSLAGPRPERPEHLRQLEKEIPFHRMRHAVRPGITGWAQVHYGYIASVEDARIGLEYGCAASPPLWLDLVIILKSVGQMLRFRGR